MRRLLMGGARHRSSRGGLDVSLLTVERGVTGMRGILVCREGGGWVCGLMGL
jgi:hypothetical protein